jgi:hypothetical protein
MKIDIHSIDYSWSYNEIHEIANLFLSTSEFHVEINYKLYTVFFNKYKSFFKYKNLFDYYDERV